MIPPALILHATGTNRDHEAALALGCAGASPEIVPLAQLRAGEKRFSDYQILVLPGGFAYADALGAGKLLALDLNLYFADAVNKFVSQGKPVIGICNGFQALVKAGILPNHNSQTHSEPAQTIPNRKSKIENRKSLATLTFNSSGHFECRWITLKNSSQKCIWTCNLTETVYCPVAHGEGNFQVAEDAAIETLRAHDEIALRYVRDDGSPAAGTYPFNPNGSRDDIAGVCNAGGNVLGLMPHPEDHIFNYQHPRHTRGEYGQLGLQLFTNGVLYASQL